MATLDNTPDCVEVKEKYVQNLNIHIDTPSNNLQIGRENTMVYIRSTSQIDEDKNNNIPTAKVSIVSEKNNVKVKYNTIHDQPTLISIGEHCNMVEIIFNDELQKRLEEAGEFRVTKGEKLVSVFWRSDATSEDTKSLSDWKVKFLKTDGSELDTLELEKEISKNLADENNNGVNVLISNLLSLYKAKLKHIEFGCIQLVLATQTREDVKRLEEKKDELKDLLKRTIIPDHTDIDIDIELKPTDDDNEEIPAACPEPSDEAIQPVKASKILSAVVELTPTIEVTSNESFDERRSIKRTVGANPNDSNSKFNPFRAITDSKKTVEARQLSNDSMTTNEEDIGEVAIPLSELPSTSKGATLEIINEEETPFKTSIESTIPLQKADTGGEILRTSSTTSYSSDSLPNRLALYQAIEHNTSSEEIIGLLDAGADLSETDSNGNTALHLAIQFNNMEAVKVIVDHMNPSDINCGNKNNDRPLHLACVANKTEMVKLLLNKGASSHADNVDGDTPLHLAVRYGSRETVILLLQNPRFLAHKNKNGNTSLHVAARYDKCEMIELLLNANVSVNISNNSSESPLMVAVKKDNLKATEVLLNNGADVNTRDDKGDTPLHIAAARNNQEIVDLLLKRPDINVGIYNNDRCSASFRATGAIREELIRRGCNTQRGWKCLIM